MARSSGFAFIDEGEALRALDVDRDTLLVLVREKRLRSYPGVGKGNFYRLADVQALARELRSDDGGAESGAEAEETTEATPIKGKLFDPAYKVHVRLLADLKWYDLSDDDLEAWTREMTADGYTRQQANITMVIERLQRLLALMDERAAGWRELKPIKPAQPTARRELPMASAPSAAPAPTPQPITLTPRRELPRAKSTLEPDAPATEAPTSASQAAPKRASRKRTAQTSTPSSAE